MNKGGQADATAVTLRSVDAVAASREYLKWPRRGAEKVATGGEIWPLSHMRTDLSDLDVDGLVVTGQMGG
ncbi:hypothetical protein GCM10010319_24850 [Streptomyces blastmyceticus]|uniref:Uncharacterized protein n=1 Tax=Streptomyces blastmyceticus TaxID=68180 RepID=A0ABP3GMW2_9ACTN